MQAKSDENHELSRPLSQAADVRAEHSTITKDTPHTVEHGQRKHKSTLPNTNYNFFDPYKQVFHLTDSCSKQMMVSVLLIVLFHIFFYLIVIGLTIALAFGSIHFHYTFDQPEDPEGVYENLPAYRGSNSYFHNAIPIRYRPVNENDRKSNLLKYKLHEKQSWENYVEQLNNIVNAESKNLNHYKHCENINRPWKLNEKLCRVYDLLGNKDLSYWGSCTSKQQFGFPAGSPCILLQLNRVISWVPSHLTNQDDITHFLSTELNYQEENILVPKLSTNTNSNANRMNSSSTIKLSQKDKVICFTCKGKSSKDQQLLNQTKINYFPKPGTGLGPCIPAYYFPYSNQLYYLSPFIFVQFQNFTRNTTINIQCKAFNTAIKGDGIVNFRLEIRAPPGPGLATK